MAGRLDRKVALVTGAASGIGAHCALRFAQEGARVAGLDLKPAVFEELLDVDPEAWQAELAGQKEFLEKYGNRMPEEMWKQYRALEERLGAPAR